MLSKEELLVRRDEVEEEYREMCRELILSNCMSRDDREILEARIEAAAAEAANLDEQIARLEGTDR